MRFSKAATIRRPCAFPRPAADSLAASPLARLTCLYGDHFGLRRSAVQAKDAAMGSRSTPMSASTERRAIIALFAIFALLVQSLIPSIALAASNGRDAGYICAAGGHGGEGGDPAPQHHGGGGCDHCVCPVAVGTPPTVADLALNAVRYEQAADHGGFGAEFRAPGRGLAAPPPPSRGPPSLTA